MDFLKDLMEQTEDPMKKMFLESMTLQMEIAKAKETSIELKIKALDELQRAYLSLMAAETMEETGKNLGKAIGQARRLKDED